MRWRVGLKPTVRSMAFTSCQGHPVSAGCGRLIEDAPASGSAVVKAMVCGNGMDYPDTIKPTGKIVASVTYTTGDAKVP
jgi:hypothetical protein